MNKINIVLIGMMGSGKTTVGQLVAQKLNLPFIDTDTMIEAGQKAAIPHIFEQYGESYFRGLEAKAAIEAAGRKNTVIATGGGMVINPANMAALSRTGLIVYLKCSPETLHERTAGDQSRPLQSKIEELLKQRTPLYEKYSQLTISDGTIIEKAELIINEYSHNKRPKP